MIILSIIAAALSLFGVLYDKTTQNKNLRVIILVAILGFIFSVTQLGVKAIGDDAAGRQRSFIDSITARMNLKTDTVITFLKSTNLQDVGVPLKLQQVNTVDDALHMNTRFRQVAKGSYGDYLHYFNTLFNDANVNKDNYALSMTLSGSNKYKLNFMLNYLLTIDLESFNQIKASNAFFNENYILNSVFFEKFKAGSPIFKYVCFFDDRNTLIGYANSKELVDELYPIYLENRRNNFDNRLRTDPVKTIQNLRSYKNLILQTNNTKEIAKILIKAHKSECIAVDRQKYYKVDLTDIVEI